MPNVITQTYAALERLASSKLNALVSAINAHDHSSVGGVPITETKHVIWYIAGDQEASTTITKGARVYIDVAGTITRVRLHARTAPTDASLIVDLHLNGTTIWSTQGNRATLTTGNTDSSTTTFNTTAIASGQYLDMFVDAIGTTLPGTDLTVELTFTA